MLDTCQLMWTPDSLLFWSVLVCVVGVGVSMEYQHLSRQSPKAQVLLELNDIIFDCQDSVSNEFHELFPVSLRKNGKINPIIECGLGCLKRNGFFGAKYQMYLCKQALSCSNTVKTKSPKKCVLGKQLSDCFTTSGAWGPTLMLLQWVPNDEIMEIYKNNTKVLQRFNPSYIPSGLLPA